MVAVGEAIEVEVEAGTGAEVDQAEGRSRRWVGAREGDPHQRCSADIVRLRAPRSQGQQAKLAQMNEANPKALPAIFKLVKMIMQAKDHVTDQLDDADADVKATTAGEKGGEGYVALGSKTKLVPRTRWQPN